MALFTKKQELPADIAARIPPGQQLTVKWPVLTYGRIPHTDLATWDFRVSGLVEEQVTFNWDEFMALPQTRRHNDIHCVTRWSKLDNDWDGVAVLDLMKHVTLKPEARAVVVHAEHNFTANLMLDDFMRDDNLFAHSHDGQPLTPEHGYPLRLVVPHLYFWKSVKFVRGLEFVAEDQPGFWERNGYHMRGDPWDEERYSSWW
ncbi:MAG: sulfite oxidase-like oxidoreductase [Chloroflexi bacterium]|nr:sulfite oxidase-like oxidoreductase [Chloroflexota bacterium]